VLVAGTIIVRLQLKTNQPPVGAQHVGREELQAVILISRGERRRGESSDAGKNIQAIEKRSLTGGGKKKGGKESIGRD